MNGGPLALKFQRTAAELAATIGISEADAMAYLLERTAQLVALPQAPVTPRLRPARDIAFRFTPRGRTKRQRARL